MPEQGSPGGSVGINLPASIGDADSLSAPERVPGEGNGNSLQYSYLGNPMDTGAGGLQFMGLKNSDVA